MAKIMRWIAVPISCLVAWQACLLVGIAAVSLLDALCPKELIVSGACTAAWYGPAFHLLLMLFSGAAAMLIVLLPAHVAPSNRFGVAIVAFVCGAAYATFAATLDRLFWGPFLAATIAGTLALRFASARWRRPFTSA